MHPSIYFECQGVRVGQADAEKFLEIMLEVAKQAEEVRKKRLETCFRALLASRLLLLEAYMAYVGSAWKKMHCKRWLVAQLDGVCVISVKLFGVLSSASLDVVDAILHRVIARLKERKLVVHFLFDEAHTLHEPKYGQFDTATGRELAQGDTRTLFTKAVYLSRQMKLASLWVGTALSIGHLHDMQSAVLEYTGHPVAWIVADFPALDAAAVRKVLAYFLDISDGAVDMLSLELVGRGRLSASFIVACLEARAQNEQDVLSTFAEYRRYTLSHSPTPSKASIPKAPVMYYDVWTRLLQSGAISVSDHARP